MERATDSFPEATLSVVEVSACSYLSVVRFADFYINLHSYPTDESVGYFRSSASRTRRQHPN